MNRRGFLAMLAGLPFVAKAMVATEQRVCAVKKVTAIYGDRMFSTIQSFRIKAGDVLAFCNSPVGLQYVVTSVSAD